MMAKAIKQGAQTSAHTLPQFLLYFIFLTTHCFPMFFGYILKDKFFRRSDNHQEIIGSEFCCRHPVPTFNVFYDLCSHSANSISS